VTHFGQQIDQGLALIEKGMPATPYIGSSRSSLTSCWARLQKMPAGGLERTVLPMLYCCTLCTPYRWRGNSRGRFKKQNRRPNSRVQISARGYDEL